MMTELPRAMYRRVSLPSPRGYHLGRTLSGVRMGRYDPCVFVSDRAARLALETPEGPATLDVVHDANGLVLQAFGDGAGWATSRAEGLLGLRDEPGAFEPSGAVVGRLARRFSGMHLPCLPVVFPRLVQIVLLQLVTTRDALRCWRRLVHELGREAPGGALRLPPTPSAILRTPDYGLVALGIRPKQARTLRTIARRADRIEQLAAEGPDALAGLLRALPGIGAWTVQYCLGSALGCADAVLLGDYNLPSTVAYVLTGEARADDERMLELLEPYRGHRFRVIRLIWMNGVFAPRRGPRLS